MAASVLRLNPNLHGENTQSFEQSLRARIVGQEEATAGGGGPVSGFFGWYEFAGTPGR